MTTSTDTCAPAGQEVLEVTGVGKRFNGLAAVSDMSLTVRRGETVAIIGPNGAGKSTFFGLIAGEHACSSGRIRFVDQDVTRWSANRRARAGISRTFQVARLFPSRTVTDHLRLAVAAKKAWYRKPWDSFDRSSRVVAEDVDEILTALGLMRLRNAVAAGLAQGDRKRLELAMAMIQRPRLLLLDEPTAGMSNEDCALTVELLRTVHEREPELTVVMTGHDMQVLLSLAGRIVLMAEGRLAMDGTPEAVSSSDVAKRIYLGDADG